MEMTKVRPERIMRGLRPRKSASMTGEEGGDNGAEEDGGDDGGELAGGEAGGGFEIGERAADDTDVDAVEQAAEAGDEEEEALVAGVGVGVRRAKLRGRALRPSEVGSPLWWSLAFAGASDEGTAWVGWWGSRREKMTAGGRRAAGVLAAARAGWRLLGFGELEEGLAAAGFDGGELAVPAVDEGFLVFDFAEFEELGGKGGLADAVGFGLALGASDGGLGLALGFGDGFSGFGLGFGELVAGLLGGLDGLCLAGDGGRR